MNISLIQPRNILNLKIDFKTSINCGILLTNSQIYGTIIMLHKSNKTFYGCAFLSLVKMHTPFSAFLVKVVKICVATIGDAFFVRSNWGALFILL